MYIYEKQNKNCIDGTLQRTKSKNKQKNQLEAI